MIHWKYWLAPAAEWNDMRASADLSEHNFCSPASALCEDVKGALGFRVQKT